MISRASLQSDARACRSGPRRAALTLVELLAATVLSALLMILVAGILRSITRQQAWVASEAGRSPAVVVVGDLLERDLDNARHIATGAGRLRLRGLLAEDPSTHLPTHRRAEVVYEVRRLAGHRCLIRTLAHTSGNGAPERWRRVVWLGAGRLVTQQFRLPTNLGAPTPDDQTVPGMDPMPPRLEVVVYDESGDVLCRVNAVR